MNSRSEISGDLSNLLKVVVVMTFFLLMTGPVLAQSSLKATGEIVSASQTTINGFPAISGTTVFSNNRISTGKHGAAIINLGRLGRIELGAETDMTLRFSGASIGGELHSNRVVVSARSGIPVTINTGKGMITTDGRQPAVLTIFVNSSRARVLAHVGAASVISTSKEGRQNENRLTQGEELSQSPGVEGWRRASLSRGATPATNAARGGQVAGAAAATATPDDSTFTGLFKAGVNQSIDSNSASKPNKDPGADKSFETSMTCRNSDNAACQKKSEFKPKRP